MATREKGLQASRGQSQTPRRISENTVRVSVEKGPYKGLGRQQIMQRGQAMLKVLSLVNVELSILITDDKHIRTLNHLYRGYDKPTDVLAFPMQESEFAAPLSVEAMPKKTLLLGDVVISVPTAEKQAMQAGRDVLTEVTFLLAHGLLHLLGWDHETPSKDRKMRAETERLCAEASAHSFSFRTKCAQKKKKSTKTTSFYLQQQKDE